MTSTLPATPATTLGALLTSSKRSGEAVPIRTTFVQGRTLLDKPKKGPLAELVRRHDELGLDLYLLFRAISAAEPWDCTKPAGVWARALNLATANGTYDITAISKAWRRLEDQRLVIRSRKGRLACITALDESGTGRAYRHHAGVELYLRLPYAFWHDEWHRRLKLRGKAMLLVGLSLPRPFTLPTERVKEWYGLSADTAERGFRELRQQGLLEVKRVVKEAPLAPEGITVQNRYTLLAPFDVRRRRNASDGAA